MSSIIKQVEAKGFRVIGATIIPRATTWRAHGHQYRMGSRENANP